MAKLTEVNQKIAEKVVGGYTKMQDTVVGGYMKMQDGIVEGSKKVMDSCVETLFTKEGETVEEAKKRLSENTK